MVDDNGVHGVWRMLKMTVSGGSGNGGIGVDDDGDDMMCTRGRPIQAC